MSMSEHDEKCRHRCPECRMGLGTHLTCDPLCEEDAARCQEARDEAEWLQIVRGDVIRALRDRGWTPDEARSNVDAIPDEVLQLIRSHAVNELAECYIFGMRATIRIREALAYAKGMYPPDTERAIEARRRRTEGLAAFSRRGNG